MIQGEGSEGNTQKPSAAAIGARSHTPDTFILFRPFIVLPYIMLDWAIIPMLVDLPVLPYVVLSTLFCSCTTFCTFNGLQPGSECRRDRTLPMPK